MQMTFSAIADVSTWQPPANSRACGEAGAYRYHRLFRHSPRTRWWKPLASVPVFILIYLALSIPFVVPFVLGGIDVDNVQSPTTPAEAIMTFGSIALMIPALIITLLIFSLPVKTLFSVARRFRWKWFGITLGISLVIYLVLGVGQLALDGTLNPSTWTPPTTFSYTAINVIALIVFIAIIVPLQCLAEEMVFRGWLFQMFGTWIKNPIFAMFATALLFTVGHAYIGWTMFSVMLFGVVTVYITWRTGGIEASFSCHAVNNMYSAGLLFFVTGNMSAEGDLGAAEFISSAIVYALFIGAIEFVLWRKRRNGTPLQNALIVEPTFPNRAGDPAPQQLGVWWNSEKWVIVDHQRFYSMMQRYIYEGGFAATQPGNVPPVPGAPVAPGTQSPMAPGTRPPANYGTPGPQPPAAPGTQVPPSAQPPLQSTSAYIPPLHDVNLPSPTVDMLIGDLPHDTTQQAPIGSAQDAIPDNREERP